MIFLIIEVVALAVITKKILNGRIKVKGWMNWAFVINIIVWMFSLFLVHLLPNETIVEKTQKIYPISTNAGQIYLIKNTDDNLYWYFVKTTEAPACQSVVRQNVAIEYLPPGTSSCYVLEKKKCFKNKALDLLFNIHAFRQPQIVFQIPPGGIAKVMR